MNWIWCTSNPQEVNAYVEESITPVASEITIQFSLKLVGTGSSFYLMKHFVSFNLESKELILKAWRPGPIIFLWMTPHAGSCLSYKLLKGMIWLFGSKSPPPMSWVSDCWLGMFSSQLKAHSLTLDMSPETVFYLQYRGNGQEDGDFYRSGILQDNTATQMWKCPNSDMLHLPEQ